MDWRLSLLVVALFQVGVIVYQMLIIRRCVAWIDRLNRTLQANVVLMNSASQDIAMLREENDALRSALSATTTVDDVAPMGATGMREALTKLLAELKRRDN